jgi:hypothetical protein
MENDLMERNVNGIAWRLKKKTSPFALILFKFETTWTPGIIILKFSKVITFLFKPFKF